MPPPKTPTSGTGTAAQRPLTEYVGDYGHCGFGNFSVYLEDDSLRYKFGLLMRGPLKASEKRDTFYMTLDSPLTKENYDPAYPRGFPVMFAESDGSDGKIDQVKVPFLEPVLVPVFKKCMKTQMKAPSAGGPAHKASVLAMWLVVVITALSWQ